MNADDAPNAAYLDHLWDERCGVLYKAWVAHRYHRHRQRFFDLADKVTKAGTVLLGATLVGELLKAHQPLLGGVISFFGLLALVFGYGDRKQAHKEVAEQAAALIANIEQVPSGQLTAEKTAGWKAEYARLCAKAPPVLKTLTVICEREQSIADGKPDHIPNPHWARRFVSDFF